MANRCHATDLDFRILSTLPTYLSLGSIILYIHTGHISIQNIQLQIIDIFFLWKHYFDMYLSY